MAFYDKFARIYDPLFAPFERRSLGRWRKEALAYLPTNSHLLEIGAGTGANFALYPPSKPAVSTELSAKMLEIANGRLVNNLPVQADAQYLPFSANGFDAAFATLVFCSIPDPAAAFIELRRVVRPDGMIVLLEHVRPQGLLGRCFDILNVFTTALIDDHFNRETARLATECGLTVTNVVKKAGGVVNIIVCRNEK